MIDQRGRYLRGPHSINYVCCQAFPYDLLRYQYHKAIIPVTGISLAFLMLSEITADVIDIPNHL